MPDVVAAAAVRITPTESRAIGRFLVAVSRLVARMGYGWAMLAVFGTVLLGAAAYTMPMWLGWVRDWWEQ